MDRPRLTHARSHWSLASDRPGGWGCWTRGGGKREHGGPDSELIGARKVTEWRHVHGEGGSEESFGAARSGLKNGARRSGGGAVEVGVAGAPFYRVGGVVGRLGVGGEWAAAVVCHNGGGGGRFEIGSAKVVVGSDEGGAPAVTGVEEVPGGGGRKHTRGGGGDCGLWSREEDDRVRPTCQREGVAGWLGQLG
jgi:hypothetical protein